MATRPLSQLSDTLINSFEKNEIPSPLGDVTVNPLIAKVASWYEKVRNAMDYREEEVILRAAIERILKRRFLLSKSGKTVAEPLIHELVWARYFEDNIISESIIEKIAERIDIYFKLREQILVQKRLSEKTINEWIYQLMSADIACLLSPNREKEIIGNFMFQIMRQNVTIIDENEQTKDVQVFIAVRRSFARDDIAFLRYHLFCQVFGGLSRDNIPNVSSSFILGYEEIQKQLTDPLKDKIYTYIKNKTGIFFILEDLLRIQKGNMRQLSQDKQLLTKTVLNACALRYSGIAVKVRRAIVRSFFFVLFTKAFFALTIEGTVESIFYGRILWRSMLFNTAIPPLLMVLAGFSIRTPKDDNSARILSHIETILFNDHPKLGMQFIVGKNRKRIKPLLHSIFTVLWFLAFVLSFGVIIFSLIKLHFTVLSIVVFLFFLAIISFLSYRIWLMSRIYTVEERQGLMAPIIDFLFMPIIQVGRHLTEGISQLNILLFILDFIIETPFKGLFGFFEQWFLFLQAKREDLG